MAGNGLTYCPLQNLKDMFDERGLADLSQDSGTQTTMDTARVTRIADIAASKFDSVAQGRYPVPCVLQDGSVPGVVTWYVAMEIIKTMFGRRADLPAFLKDEIEDARKWLEDLTNRKVSLPGLDRSNVPVLEKSDRTDGSSRFDRFPFNAGR